MAGSRATSGLLLLLVLAVPGLLDALWYIPIDAFRTDVPIVVDRGIKTFLAGETPYRYYHVPWPVPLPQLPVLWLPYTPFVALGLDLRLLPLLVVSSLGAVVGLFGVGQIARGKILRATTLFVVAAAILFNPAFRGARPHKTIRATSRSR